MSASSQARSQGARAFVLAYAVHACALEPVHFHTMSSWMPRSLLKEAEAECELYSQLRSKQEDEEELYMSSAIDFAFLPKATIATLTAIAMIVCTVLSPHNLAQWTLDYLHKLHMQVSGEQNDDEDEQEDVFNEADVSNLAERQGRPNAFGALTSMGMSGIEVDESMSPEEREIARAAARYQLAIESERLRVFGLAPRASAIGLGLGGIAAATAALHQAPTTQVQRGRRTNSSLLQANSFAGRPELRLGEVPSRPSWRPARERQPSSNVPRSRSISPRSLSPLSASPRESHTSSSASRDGSSSPFGTLELPNTSSPILNSRRSSVLPRHSSGSRRGSRNEQAPADSEQLEAQEHLEPSSTASSEADSDDGDDLGSEDEDSEREEDSQDEDGSPSLSPTSTFAAFPGSSGPSTADLLQLCGPPLSPSFGPLDDVEDFARCALGTAATSTSMRSLLEAEERGLARLVRLEALAEPDDFDLAATGSTSDNEDQQQRATAAAAAAAAAKKTRPARRYRGPCALRRFFGRDDDDDEATAREEEEDSTDTDVEREAVAPLRAEVC